MVGYQNKKKNKYKTVIFISACCLAFFIIGIALFVYKDNKYLSVVKEKINIVTNKIGINISTFQGAKEDLLKSKKEILSEKEQLEKEVQSLKEQLLAYEELKENYNLLLEFSNIVKRYPEYEFINATILYRNITLYNYELILNVGSNDGILKDQTVISEDGFVGVVKTVENNKCVVKTMLDNDLRVSVKINGINDIASFSSLREKLTYKIRISDIPYDEDIQENTVVRTSGLGIYIGEIPIGKISKVYSDNNSITKKADVEPFVDVRKIKYVSVIKESK